MKEKQLYQAPKLEEIPISVENAVCDVSPFTGFGQEEDWDE